MTTARVLTGPSPHLSWMELACRDKARTPYPEQWRSTRALRLGAEFEIVRSIVGAPLEILSGYRTPAHNRAVGGARASQHVEGRALDLLPPRGWTPKTLFEAILEAASQADSRIKGIGLYPTFAHIDIRESPRLVVWRGGRVAADFAKRTEGA